MAEFSIHGLGSFNINITLFFIKLFAFLYQTNFISKERVNAWPAVRQKRRKTVFIFGLFVSRLG